MSAPIVRLVGCPEALLQPLHRALLELELLPEDTLATAPEVVILWLLPDSEAAGQQVAALREALRPALPAILGVGPVADGEPGAAASADLDAQVVSGEPREIARQCLLLGRCRQRFLQTSALTGLPGNRVLEAEISRRLLDRGGLAVLAFDLDDFKGYNDRYGYERGDGLLRWVAGLLVRATAERAGPGWLVGHLGGDDFLALARPAEAPEVARRALELFELGIGDHYDPDDRQRGGIATWDRQGREVWQPLVGLTVVQATNQADDIGHSGQLAAVLAELKRYAKTLPGSRYVADRRRNHRPPGPGADGADKPQARDQASPDATP
jgi:GGDEF domain-containing protein